MMIFSLVRTLMLDVGRSVLHFVAGCCSMGL